MKIAAGEALTLTKGCNSAIVQHDLTENKLPFCNAMQNIEKSYSTWYLKKKVSNGDSKYFCC